MRMIQFARSTVGILGVGAVATACAQQPPRELVAARSSYTTASSGNAATLAPTQLDTAHGALQQAETSYSTHGAGHETRELAETATSRSQAAAAAVAQRAQTAEQNARAATESLREVATVREEQGRMVITLSGEDLFPVGEAQGLLPIARKRLGQVAEALRKYDPRQTFTIVGYTDSSGSDATNEALSQARAQAVADFLIERGVPAKRIRTAAHGADRPIADNATPEGRASNRRVEIVVHPPQAQAQAQAVGGGPAAP